MKHSRVTAASLALTFAASLAGALPARGVEVPFTERVISTAADGARSVFAADLDGDRDTDVLSASAYDDKIAWYESDGGSPPTFTERVISTSADWARSVFATDVDGDGDTDVLSASIHDDKIAWYENDGLSPPTFTERVITEDPDGPGGVEEGFADGAFSVFATDVDGDGDTDVLSASAYDDKIAWYENDGKPDPTFTERPPISTTAGLARSVFATDVDGDGDTDVLSASQDDDKIAWYENDGLSPPTFTERVITEDPDGPGGVEEGFADTPFSVFATDLDGDGDTDVLSASIHDDKIAWYENDGLSPPTFTERVISTTAYGALTVFATDVDGDGDIDVLSASYLDDKIALYENDGGSPPTFIERVITEDPDGSGEDEGFADVAISVFATDVDGDGDTDVLSASQDDDKIAWYENTTPTCGNGAVRLGEECDDGNTDAGDGCSSICTIESGYVCIGEPSICGPDCNSNGIPDDCDLDCGTPGGPCDVEGCGSSQDNNTDGIPDECGACCGNFGDVGCVQQTQDVCEDNEGVYLGDGTVCEGDACPIPTVSEWGMVAMALLVLTAGTLVCRRRRPAQA